jgi:hypothetical protein
MPNGSNSAAMRGSGRTKRGQHSQSIEPSRPTKIADLQSPNLLGSERAKWSTGNAHKSQGERECRRKPGTAGRRRASRRRPNRPAPMSLRCSANESTAIRRRRSVIGIGAVWRRSDAREQWSISAELHCRGWLRGGSGELSISCCGWTPQSRIGIIGLDLVLRDLSGRRSTHHGPLNRRDHCSAVGEIAANAYVKDRVIREPCLSQAAPRTDS